MMPSSLSLVCKFDFDERLNSTDKEEKTTPRNPTPILGTASINSDQGFGACSAILYFFDGYGMFLRKQRIC